jgi:lipopolysaccharide/colanic/teichoic acid biosynthesis glycosyltransferase
MPPPDRGSTARRALDVVVSGAGLVALAPVLVAIAVAVRMDSRGPAMFRQERVGRHGQLFRIHKFRTMTVVHDGRPVSTESDVRVTRLGRFLRRSKLDELPQLLDVLAGHMSLVGPRPELPEFVALWSPEHREIILSVRPGITDPASIALRHEAAELTRAQDPARHYVESLLPRKAAMYAEYVATRTLARDLVVLLRTVQVVVTQ